MLIVNPLIFSVNYRILVGAPLGKNLQPNTTRSGALFKCPITQQLDDCVQVPTDGRRSKTQPFYSNKCFTITLYQRHKTAKTK